MVAPAPASAPLSYAERAKRAQNIRSPIAAPPPSKNIVPAVHVVVDTTPNSSAASAATTTTAASTISTAPSSATGSSSLSTSANDTPNSSIVLGTRASSPITSTSFSPLNTNQNSSRTNMRNPEQSVKGQRMSSGQLAVKALDIVAAHTSNGGVSKPVTTPNVWSQRIERMSAARATAATSSSSQTPNSSQNTAPAPTQTPVSVAGAGATPALVSGSTPSQSSSSATATPDVLSHNDAQGLKVVKGKPNAHQIAASTSEGDPFVVRPPAQRHAPAWAAGTSPSVPAFPPAPSSSSASVSVSMTPSTSSLGPAFSAPPSISAEAWPEVGKSVITASTSTGGDSRGLAHSAEEEHGSGDGEQEVEGGPDNKGPKSKKGKAKSKWVPIPPAELQAAADAATAAARKANAGHSHSQAPRKGNKGSNANSSGNTNTNNTNGTNTSVHNTPRSHSGRTSAVQSRAQSVQNSPRAQRGRRLPLEEGPVGLGVTADAAGPPSPAPCVAPLPSQPPVPQQQRPERHTPSPYQSQPQAPYPQQPRYNAVPPPSGPIPIIKQSSPAPSAPNTSSPYSGPDQVYVAQHHRHRSHPMQPAMPPAPTSSSHAFQVTATPFYPQAHHPQPHNDPTSPPVGAAFQASNRPPLYPPLHGAYGLPPMYPMYPPPSFGYGGWQPPNIYGSLPPQQQQQGYVPLQYPDGPQVPPPNAQGVEENRSTATNEVSATRAQAAPEANSEQVGAATNSPSATGSPREKMMFGSIDSSIVLSESGDVSPAVRRNGSEGAKTNGEISGSVSPVALKGRQEAKVDEQLNQTQAKESAQKKDTKGKSDKKPKATNGTPTEREKDGVKTSAGKHLEGTIPAVQLAQSAQAEVKWKFGTASSTPPVQLQQALPPAEEEGSAPSQQQQRPTESVGPLQTSNTMPALSGMHSYQTDDGLSPFAEPLDPRGSASFAHFPPTLPLPPLMPVGPLSPRDHGLGFGDALVSSIPSAGTDSDLDVKDYGYGFGDASGSGYATALARQERLEREREFEAEREKEREMAVWREDQKVLVLASAALGQPGFAGGAGMDEGRIDETLAVPEAGPSHGGYAPIREPGSWRGDGGRGGRRGGAFGTGPGGRGFGSERGGGYGNRRGRGANGYSRGYGRGGYGRGGGVAPVPHRTPPFTVTPPQHLRPLAPMNELRQAVVGASYYPPSHQISASYLSPLLPPSGFDGYGSPPSLPAVNGAPPMPQLSPPVPVPMSPVSFPLDPTRYYLLGQLEYYLSPQNMASDFFLRQHMDARGWIPIPLIASFNRVKQLTMDVHFVRDVLTLSSLVQVRGNMVRMGGWERFVLPDAAPSSVEDQPLPHAYQNLGTYLDEHLQPQEQPTYEQNNQNLPAQQQNQQAYPRDDEPDVATQWRAEGSEGPNGTGPLVNGHSAKLADVSHLEEEEEDEDEDEEDVVFVMGHEAATAWSPERGT